MEQIFFIGSNVDYEQRYIFFQPWLIDVLFSHQTTMNKKNLGRTDQAREGGFMVGWKTIGTNHVNFELTSTNKSSKCKSTSSISIINHWKSCITPKI
jgi:hypothetical protein